MMLIGFGVLLSIPFISLWTQYRLQANLQQGCIVIAHPGLSGAALARKLLVQQGVPAVSVELSADVLGDHYDAGARKVRLSPEVYNSSSLTACALAAHEVGHALQPETAGNSGRALLIGSCCASVSWVALAVALLCGYADVVPLAIGGLWLGSLVQWTNAVVEVDASRRGREALAASGLFTNEERALLEQLLQTIARGFWGGTHSFLSGRAARALLRKRQDTRADNAQPDFLHNKKSTGIT